MFLKICLIISTIFLAVTWIKTPRIDLPHKILEYFNSLPIYYWISLFLLLSVLLVLIKYNGYKSLAYGMFAIIILSALLFLTPLVVFVNDPGCRDVYGHMAFSLYIVKLGRVEGSGIEEFPGSYIFMANYILLTDLNPLYIMKLWRLLYVLVWILAPYIIAKRIINGLIKSYALLAPLTIMAFSWHGFYFGKQFFAHILWAVATLSLIITSQKYIKKEDVSILILIYVTLVLSHPLTSLLLLALLIATYIYPRIITQCMPFIQRMGITSSMSRSKLNAMKYVLLAIFSIWVFYYVWTGYALGTIKGIVNLVKNLLVEREYKFVKLLEYVPLPSYSSKYLKVIYLKMFSSLFVFFTGFIMGLATLLRAQKLEYITLSLAILVPLTFFILPFSRTTLAMLNRGIEHALVPYAALASFVISTAMHLKNKKLCYLLIFPLVSLLLFMITLIPITKYSSSSFMYIPTISHETANYLIMYLNGQNVMRLRINVPDIAIRFHAMLKSNIYWYKKVVTSRGLNVLYEYFMSNHTLINEIRKYNIIVISYRYFIQDMFWKYKYPMRRFVIRIIKILNRYFNKVYTNSKYCSIYFIKVRS